jgi:hypothetical protein
MCRPTAKSPIAYARGYQGWVLRFLFVLPMVGGAVLSAADTVRFLRWPDVQSLLAGFAVSPEKLPVFKDAEEWDAWIRERDASIRGRVDHGIEDSISELILFGTSFPAPPKLGTAADAVNAAGDLTAKARARRDAFVQAIDQLDNERFRIVLEFLRRRRITEEELGPFLSGSLRSFALEEAGLPKKQVRADVGISPETSLLINFALEDILRGLQTHGALPARIRRIAVIGPGLDLAGDPDVNDFCPLQSIQPFAILEAVLRLGLATPSEIQITAVDLNPLVLSHLRTSLGKAHAAQRYVLQLPRPSSAGWNAAAVSYWQHFGEIIGTPATPGAAPPGIELRAIAVNPPMAARVTVDDLDIVTQTLDASPGQGFDLVVATNLFGYYTRVEQTLALTSIARMLSSGGIVLSNGLLPKIKLQEFEDLGVRHVSYLDSGGGDDLTAHKRR